MSNLITYSGNNLATDDGLRAYIKQVNKFPMLSFEEEQRLAEEYVAEGKLSAAQALVESHLRLVVKIAYEFKNYGLTMADVIAEGNIGLMQAVKKFDPTKGFRLSTYAMWWIKASINDFVLRSWSIVKVGSSATQKKLFYNLRRLKNNIFGEGSSNRALYDDEISTISNELGVSEKEVVDMDTRMTAYDVSTNKQVSFDGEGTAEYGDFLSDDNVQIEADTLADNEFEYKRRVFASAMQALNEREQDIVLQRRMNEETSTLEDLSKKHGVSKERIRQIENRALEKLQAYVAENA